MSQLGVTYIKYLCCFRR